MIDKRIIVIEACGSCPYCQDRFCIKDLETGGVDFEIPDLTKIADFCPLPLMEDGKDGYTCTKCGKIALIATMDSTGNITDVMCCSCFAKEFNEYQAKNSNRTKAVLN